MVKSFYKRLLSAGLAVFTAVSMFPVSAFAAEEAERKEEIIELMEESADDVTFDTSEEVEVPISEEEIPSSEVETDIEDKAQETASGDDADGGEATEYFVAPGYEGTYTESDVEEYFENEYSLIEGSGEAEEEGEFFATAADLRTVLKRRDTTYSYTDSSFNAKSLIEGALVDTNEKDPTGGDYIKGNLIGYSASGRGYGSTWNITINFMWASYSNPASEESAVNKKVQEIKSELDLTSATLSDFEKVKAIDDYLQATIKYTNDGTYGCHGTYAALIRGKCVCQGYATAFLRLTREAGVASKYITGMKIDHAWNIVKVEGGTDPERPWYNNDTTWGRFLENDIQFLDHPRDKEYASDSYKKKHPVALYDWGKTTAGIDEANPEFSFKSIDGLPMISTVDPESKKPKIMVFYHYGESNKSEYPAQLLKSIESHKVLKNQKVEVYAIDVASDPADVKAFMSKNGLGSLIRFAAWDENSNAAYEHFKIGGSPFVVMVDENNRVQFANSYYSEFITKKFGELVWSSFMYYLVSDWDHTAVIKSITLDKSTLSLDQGDSETLTVSYNPEKTCDDKTVTFSSSDETVATVISTGMGTATVTATGSGVATITAKCMDKTTTCRVTTFIPITGISITSDTDTVFVGERVLFSALVSPKKSDVKHGYSWTADKPDIAGVNISDTGDSCTLLGKKPGEVQLTVTADGYNDTKKVTVISSDIILDYQGATPGDDDPVVIAGTYGEAIGQLPVPTYEGHIFMGWYTGKNRSGIKVSENTKVTRYQLGESFVLYAGYKETVEGEFTILPVSDQTFTGTALKPQVIVYYGDEKLTPLKDYSVKYTNNKAAYTLMASDEGFSENSVPTVTVTGKGNFAGTATANFRILPKNLADADITVDSNGLYLTENGKLQKAVPILKYGKTVLKAGKDFELEYPDTDAGDYVRPGQNKIVVTAAEGGNYKGTRTLLQTIVRADLVKISKCTVSVGKSYEYTGEAIKPVVIVKSGKTVLTEDRDYKLILSDNTEVGTASVIISGIGGFTGSRKASFKITGVSIAKADVTLSETSYIYDGTAHKPDVIVRAKKTDSEPLTAEKDYTVSYISNVNKGKATVLITGRGKYSGTAKKTFKIIAAKLEGAAVTFANGKEVGEESYLKGGVIPQITVVISGRTLKPGSDYTLKYAGNNQIYEYKGQDKKAPQIMITGKGNYSGRKIAYFGITPAKLQDREEAFVLADDCVYSSKQGKWKGAVSVFDANGKKLQAGKDYDKNITYTYEETGAEVGAMEAPAIGTGIVVTVTGIKAYEGTVLSASYHIIADDKSIAKGINFKIADKYYNGKPVTVTKDDITFDSKTKTDFNADCFEIVENSYISNLSKGTAKVTIRGIGTYGGTKTLTFKILPKPVQ